jgi:hypothetical protein
MIDSPSGKLSKPKLLQHDGFYHIRRARSNRTAYGISNGKIEIRYPESQMPRELKP